MSFRQFKTDIEEISKLMVSSHASSGKTIAISRNNQVFTNLSAKSTLNEWHPRHRIVQKGFLDVIGSGDGGKLGCFLTISLMRSLAKHKHGGHPDLTREVLSYLPEIEKKIIAQSKEAQKEQLVSVGGGLEFADQLADAVFLSGAESHISLEKYDGVGCEVVESESFYSDSKNHHIQEQTTLKGPMVALIPKRISKFEDIIPPLELMGTFPNRPLVIICPMIRGQALATLKRNREEGIVEAYAIEAPLVTWGKGWLEDVGSFTGATLFDPYLYSDFKLEFFGSAREVTLKQGEMIIEPYDDHAEITGQRIEQLLYEANNSHHSHTQDLWRKRASMLGGTLIRVKVGGVTEAEARLKRSKTEKALLNMNLMLKNGYVDGSIPILANMKGIHPIVDKALISPLRVVGMNKNTVNLESVLSSYNCLYEPFPTERLLNLVRSSFSVATTLCSVAKIIRSKK